jgi:DNA-binding XRE family transcriptional regulator
MTRFGDSPENKVPGVWSPQQLAKAIGYSRQSIVDAINGKGKYPKHLYAQKVGQLWLIPDRNAEAYIKWSQTGEVEDLEETEKIYWSVGEIAEASGMSLTTVDAAITGIQGKYSYPATLKAVRLGNKWLVATSDAEQYIREKRAEKKGKGFDQKGNR